MWQNSVELSSTNLSTHVLLDHISQPSFKHLLDSRVSMEWSEYFFLVIVVVE